MDSISLFEKYHTAELYKAFEVKITQDAKDKSCIGMIAIRLQSPQGMTEQEQLIKLQQLAQTAIYTQAFLDIKPTDLPKTVSAFSFKINPVNHPNFIIFSLAHGTEARWYNRLDHIGHRWL
jgi:orotidine-5'-phosphate decarboxylase